MGPIESLLSFTWFLEVIDKAASGIHVMNVFTWRSFLFLTWNKSESTKHERPWCSPPLWALGVALFVLGFWSVLSLRWCLRSSVCVSPQTSHAEQIITCLFVVYTSSPEKCWFKSLLQCLQHWLVADRVQTDLLEKINFRHESFVGPVLWKVIYRQHVCIGVSRGALFVRLSWWKLMISFFLQRKIFNLSRQINKMSSLVSGLFIIQLID